MVVAPAATLLKTKSPGVAAKIAFNVVSVVRSSKSNVDSSVAVPVEVAFNVSIDVAPTFWTRLYQLEPKYLYRHHHLQCRRH